MKENDYLCGMNKIDLNVNGMSYRCYGDEQPKVVLIQMLDEDEYDSFEEEVNRISTALEGHPIAMIGVEVNDWMADLSPWADKMLRIKDGVAKADVTLSKLTDDLFPVLRQRFGNVPLILGGYSLAGMFALWTARETSQISGVAAMSPSLWVEGWEPFAESHEIHAQVAYLSLGDREERARNKHMARVGDGVRQEHLRLTQVLGPDNTTLVLNKGGHFDDPLGRTIDGFSWTASRLLSILSAEE